MWHKSWQNKRPGWTRRVRWSYVPHTDEQVVHLRFDERLPNNDARERWDITVPVIQAELIWQEYMSEDSRDAKDIFLDVMEEQEQND